MLRFKKESIPNLDFEQAVKKPTPIRCCQINEEFVVETMEGMMKGKKGDYLIIGVENEMYPCDQAIFHKTYEIKEK